MMLKSNKARFAAATAMALVLTGAGTAHAQQADAIPSETAEVQDAGTTNSSETAGIEEIIVSARRVEENAQRVPISVVAVSEDKIDALSLVDVRDLQKIVPGFQVHGSANGTFSFMRGLQGIASYFADAPVPRGITGQFFDVGSVQVLKGPQGTLFGTSSAAGAIVVNPRKPTEDLNGYVGVTLGGYGRRTIEGAISVPVIEDKLLFRLAAQSWYRDGYIFDPLSGTKFADRDYRIIRPSVIFRPTENIENYTMFQYYESRDNGFGPNEVIDYVPGGVFANSVGAATADRLLAESKANPYFIAGGAVLPAGFMGTKTRQLLLVNNLRWDITDNLALTHIFSWRREGSRTANAGRIGDTAFGLPANDPRAIAARTAPLNMQNSYSNEVKLTGNALDGAIDFTLGNFMSWNKARGEIAFGNAFGVLTASRTNGDPQSPKYSAAVYGQADIDVGRYVGTDGLTLTLGYRNTWNTVYSERRNYFVVPNVPVADLAFQDVSEQAKFSDSNWLVGLRYQATPSTMIYATASKGVTTGLVQPQLPAALSQFRVVNPETLEQLELGVKSTFSIGNMQVRANLNGYYGWYSDIQSATIRYIQVSPPPAPPTGVLVTENAASGLVRGIDAELTVAPASWLEFTFNGAYNKNKYTDWPKFGPNGEFLFQDRRPFLGAPEFKYFVAATIRPPIPERMGRLAMNANYSHAGRAYLYGGLAPFESVQIRVPQTAANGYGPLSADGAVVCRDCDEPYGEVNVSVDWSDFAGIEGLSLNAGVTNLTKNRGAVGGLYGSFSVGLYARNPAVPRMYTFGMKYAF